MFAANSAFIQRHDEKRADRGGAAEAITRIVYPKEADRSGGNGLDRRKSISRVDACGRSRPIDHPSKCTKCPYPRSPVIMRQTAAAFSRDDTFIMPDAIARRRRALKEPRVKQSRRLSGRVSTHCIMMFAHPFPFESSRGLVQNCTEYEAVYKSGRCQLTLYEVTCLKAQNPSTSLKSFIARLRFMHTLFLHSRSCSLHFRKISEKFQFGEREREREPRFAHDNAVNCDTSRRGARLKVPSWTSLRVTGEKKLS